MARQQPLLTRLAKAERDASRFRTRLETQDHLLEKLRQQQRWASDALDGLHIPLLGFNFDGELNWHNRAAVALLGLGQDGEAIHSDALPPALREVARKQVGASGDSINSDIIKLHGQRYSVAFQLAPIESGQEDRVDWIVSLLPAPNDPAPQPKSQLLEAPYGHDDSGLLQWDIGLAQQELMVEFQGVASLNGFWGSESLVKLQASSKPEQKSGNDGADASVQRDLSVIESLCARLLSDRLGLLAGDGWIVPLCEASLHHEGFGQALLDILGRYQVIGTRFIFAVAEDEAMDALVLVQRLQKQLRMAGVRWAMVNCSADLRNFEYLSNLEWDFYNLNVDLVAQAQQSQRAQKVLQALCDAAVALGMATLATGVDERELVSTLRGLAVDYVSGQWATDRLLTERG